MQRFCLQALAAALAVALVLPAQSPQSHDGAAFSMPHSETLSYNVEWRFIHAGTAKLTWNAAPNGGGGWVSHLQLESAGLVSRLFKVNDNYSALMTDRLCMRSSFLDANEGNRRRETRVTFDANRRKASCLERDLSKNTSHSQEIDIRPCEHDVLAGLYQLRLMHPEPGRSIEIPVSDGKKAVMAKVEAQEREVVKTDYGTYKTTRYEVFLFNNVLYRRRGRLFVWITDDDRRLPVQIRVRMPFYIGTVTLQLEKEGKA